VISDLNGDGYPDVIALSRQYDDTAFPPAFRSRAEVFLNTVDTPGGPLGFVRTQAIELPPAPSSGDPELDFVVHGVAADLNGDGRVDLATVSEHSAIRNILDVLFSGADPEIAFLPGLIHVLLQQDDGTFSEPQLHELGLVPSAIAASDIDLDGHVDLVATTLVSTSAELFLGDGQGGFEPERSFEVSFLPRDLLVSDLDGNGLDDILTVNGFGSRLELHKGQPDGSFVATEIPTPGQNEDLWSGDLDEDGYLDLVVRRRVADGQLEIAALLGRGDGDFDELYRHNTIASNRVAVLDVDGDDALDVVYPVSWRYKLGLIHGQRLPGYSVTGSLAPPSGLSNQRPSSTTSADLDQDGNSDVVVANINFPAITIYYGLDSGEFEPPVVVQTDYRPFTLQVHEADDPATLPDIAVANSAGEAFSILRQTSPRVFEARSFNMSQINRANSIDLGFVNDDTIPDALVIGGTYVSVFLGTGDGGFLAADSFRLSSEPFSGIIRDVNADGFGDLVVDGTDGAVDVLIGDGSGTFERHRYHGRRPDGAGGCVPDAVCGRGMIDGGESTCVPTGTCSANYHPGVEGDTFCIPVGTCFASAFLDSNGRCVRHNCPADTYNRGDGVCAPRQPDSMPCLPGTHDGGAGHCVPLGTCTDLQYDWIRMDPQTGECPARPRDQPSYCQQSDEDGGEHHYHLDCLSPTYLASADFDNDGHGDLAVVCIDSSSLVVMFGDADGRFEEQHTFSNLSRPGAPYAADLNDDGLTDLVISHSFNRAVSILYGTGERDGRDIDRDGSIRPFIFHQTFEIMDNVGAVWGGDLTFNDAPPRPTVMGAIQSSAAVFIAQPLPPHPRFAPGSALAEATLPPCATASISPTADNSSPTELVFDVPRGAVPCRIERMELEVTYAPGAPDTVWIDLEGEELATWTRRILLASGQRPTTTLWTAANLAELGRFAGSVGGGRWRLRASARPCTWRSDDPCDPVDLFASARLHVNRPPCDPLAPEPAQSCPGATPACTEDLDAPDIAEASACTLAMPAAPRPDQTEVMVPLLTATLSAGGDIDHLLLVQLGSTSGTYGGLRWGTYFPHERIVVSVETPEDIEVALMAGLSPTPVAWAERSPAGDLTIDWQVPDALDGRYLLLRIRTTSPNASDIPYTITALTGE